MKLSYSRLIVIFPMIHFALGMYDVLFHQYDVMVLTDEPQFIRYGLTACFALSMLLMCWKAIPELKSTLSLNKKRLLVIFVTMIFSATFFNSSQPFIHDQVAAVGTGEPQQLAGLVIETVTKKNKGYTSYLITFQMPEQQKLTAVLDGRLAKSFVVGDSIYMDVRAGALQTFYYDIEARGTVARKSIVP